MKQQLDFLKNLPKPPRHLSTRMMGFIALGCFTFFLSLSIGVQVYKSMEKNKLKKIALEQQAEAHKFQQLAEAYPLLASDTPLVTKVAAFEKTLNEKQAEFEKLSHMTSRVPFSTYLRALALSIPSGVWLYNINISQETDSYSLSGYAIKPEDITIFIQKIQNEYPFNKTIFDLFSVKKNEKTNLVEFEIADDKLLNKETNVPSDS